MKCISDMSIKLDILYIGGLVVFISMESSVLAFM